MSKKRYGIEQTSFKLLWNGMHPDPTRKEQLAEANTKMVMRKRPGQSGAGCMAIVSFKTKKQAEEYLNTEVNKKVDKRYNIVKLNSLLNTMDW